MSKRKTISLLISLLMIVSTISAMNAADLIGINMPSTQNEHSDESHHETIPMMANEDVFAYNEPRLDSTPILNLSGGTIVNACIHSIGDDFVLILYNGYICYAQSDRFKLLIGNTSSIYEQVYYIYQKNKYQAEDCVQLKSAPNYYSVNGKTLYYNYQDFIWTLCEQWDIENYYEYLLCQFYQESRFEQSAVSPTQDYGICQINIKYQEGFKRAAGHPEWNIFTDPYANMYVGVYLMSTYIHERDGDIALALTDYNAGPNYAGNYGVKQDYYGPICYWMKTLKLVEK